MNREHLNLTEFISCPVCRKVFNDTLHRPISLECGHTVCRFCLQGRLGNERCPFDQLLFPVNIDKLPSNYALLQVIEATSLKEISDESLLDSDFSQSYELARQCMLEINVYLKPLAENSSDDEGSSNTLPVDKGQSKCYLSRPLQRKVISLIQCQILEDEGRSRAARISRSIGERIVSELLSFQQYPHQLSTNLWAAVRARGCQFLGPAMQEEALKLILLTLENGCLLSRKVLVLYVVGKLSASYPHASKTAIGHVVQLLYRASCFNVVKRDEESSLMQLKEEFRDYETLRKEHDAQIVEIAMEAGLRIPPEQWSSLLYGDLSRKSHMQSIMDKLQNPQSFGQCVSELVQVLQQSGDPGGFLKLRHRFEFLSCIDPSPEAQVPSMQDMKAVMQSLSMVLKAFVSFLSHPNPRSVTDLQTASNSRYKTSLCRDISLKGFCPRGNACTFAHSQEELERHRLKSRRTMSKPGLRSDSVKTVNDVEAHLSKLMLDTDSTLTTPSSSSSPMNDSQKNSVEIENCNQTISNDALLSRPSSQDEFVSSNSVSQASPSDRSANALLMNPSTMGNSLPFGPPATKLTFSQPAHRIPFLPHTGHQTSFHPHNVRFPPPQFVPTAPLNTGCYSQRPLPSSHILAPTSGFPSHFPQPHRLEYLHQLQSMQGMAHHPQQFHAQDSSSPGVPVPGNDGRHPGNHVFLDPSLCQGGDSRDAEHVAGSSLHPGLSTQSIGGPDMALHSLTNGACPVMVPPQETTPVFSAVLVDASQEPVAVPPPIGMTGPLYPPPLPVPAQSSVPHNQFLYTPPAFELVVMPGAGAVGVEQGISLAEPHTGFFVVGGGGGEE